ncbi:MAG: hypothetical protein Q7T40_13410 [Methylobacter sp.]|nr:hypothetical protein [Methylobacter sp.]
MATPEEIAETVSSKTFKQVRDSLEPRGITWVVRSNLSVYPARVAPTTGGDKTTWMEKSVSGGKLAIKDRGKKVAEKKTVSGGKGAVHRQWIERIGRQAFKNRGKKVEAKAFVAYPLTLFFESQEQCEEAIAVIQDLPALYQDKRKQSVETAIGFLENKPEIYHHQGLAFHILENAKLRNEFMSNVGALTSQEVATLSQSQAKNKAAYAHRLKAENKVFAVEFQGEQRYPAFQFDMETGKPKLIIKDILALVKGEWSGWQLALWFITANGYLDGKTPLEMMDTKPEVVLKTLSKEVGEVDF